LVFFLPDFKSGNTGGSQEAVTDQSEKTIVATKTLHVGLLFSENHLMEEAEEGMNRGLKRGEGDVPQLKKRKRKRFSFFISELISFAVRRRI